MAFSPQYNIDDDETMIENSEYTFAENEPDENFSFSFETQDFNEELFLRHICNFPAIYNPQQKGYSNKLLKIKAWENVSNSMGRSVEFCMRKWKSLREKYSREKEKKERSFKSGAGANSLTTWPLFSFFEFMLDKVVPRKTTSSIEIAEETEDSEAIFHQSTSKRRQSSNTNPKTVNTGMTNKVTPGCSTWNNSKKPLLDSSPVNLQTNKSIKRKTVDRDPMVEVLNKIGSSLDNVGIVHSGVNSKDKIEKFCNYMGAEIRDLPEAVQEEFMDETLIRLLQTKRKQKTNKSTS